MNNNFDSGDEPVILSFEAARRADLPPANDRKQADDSEPVDREQIESFWAGRNHAMRRSARDAA